MKYFNQFKAIALVTLLTTNVFAQEAPSVIIASTANQEQYMKLINILSNSTVYSMVTNKVLNGSGNRSFVPIQTNKPLGQILDQISFFDLYFQKNLSQAGVGQLKMDLHMLPYENIIKNYAAVDQKLAVTSVNSLVDAMGTFVKANIKLQNYSELNSAPNLNLVRQSQLEAIRDRYPVQKTSPSGSIIEQAKWLLASYLPISISTQADLGATQKILKSTFVMPALGYPKMLAQNINGATKEEFGIVPMHFSSKGTPGTIKMNKIESNAAIFTDVIFQPSESRKAQLDSAGQAEFDQINNSRVMRIELIKDLNKQHLLELALSFGYLNKNNPTSVYDMNVDLPASKENAVRMVKNSDMAMVIKGDVIFNKNMIANDLIRQKVNDYISSMYDIRLVFHKVHMTMNRLPVQDASLKYLETAANSKNLDLFLNNDVGFALKNMRYVPEKSIINVIVSVKPEVKQKIDSAKILTFDIKAAADAVIRKKLLADFCVGSFLLNTTDRVQDEDLTKCQIIFSSVEEFKSGFITKLLNSNAIGFLQVEIASSAQGQAGQAAQMIDKAIDEVMSTVIEKMQEAKALVTQRMAAKL